MDQIQRAVSVLRQGGLVAFPTETVYGLGADASNPLAVRQIFARKGRPADHPLIVHLPDATHLDRWTRPSALAQRLAARFWPGPLTLILPRADGVIDEVTGGLDTVGVRVPAHPLALKLLRALDGGVAAPSANRFGRVSPTTARHVRDELGEDLLVLDGGPCTIGIESTILDLSVEVPTLLRPGGLPVESLTALTGPLARGGKTRAPGTLPSHYAPRTALLVTTDPEAEAERLRVAGRTVAVLFADAPDRYARKLYAELRRLDRAGVDVLIAEALSDDAGLALAINDRLARAARR